MDMEYEVLNFRKLDMKGACKAMADVCFAKTVTIFGVKLFDGKNGLFLSMPNYKRPKEDDKMQYVNTCDIINKDVKSAVEKDIIAMYNKAMEVPTASAGE